MLILVLNCGGSSVKYRLISMPDETDWAQGSVERVGRPGAVWHHRVAGRSPEDRPLPLVDHAVAVRAVLSGVLDPSGIHDPVAAVGHRVVHAAEKYTGAVVIDDGVLGALRECIELAPLHNPPGIAAIEACRRLLPDAVQVGVFDNTLHRDLAPAAYLYGLPYRYYERYGVRRWGFHGISFDYVTRRAGEILGVPREELRLVTLMLGSGTTANAMRYGRSVEVSTGFTPTEGLLQSTRCGDLDPEVVTYLMRKENLDPAAMDDILTRESGWLGICGLGDLRDVEIAAARGNGRAQLALDVFVHRLKKYVGAYAAIMGGMDGLIFSGGIGEKSAAVRSAVCRGLEFMGIRLDERLNEAAGPDTVLSTPGSPAKVLVVKTDEELYIARETYRVVEGS